MKEKEIIEPIVSEDKWYNPLDPRIVIIAVILIILTLYFLQKYGVI